MIVLAISSGRKARRPRGGMRRRTITLPKPPCASPATFQHRARLLGDLGVIEHGKTFAALTTYFLAGDASYDQRRMLAGRVDGVSPDECAAEATLRASENFSSHRAVVYLPTHDPESAMRLAVRACVGDGFHDAIGHSIS